MGNHPFKWDTSTKASTWYLRTLGDSKITTTHEQKASEGLYKPLFAQKFSLKTINQISF